MSTVTDTATAPAPVDGYGLTTTPVDQYGVRHDRMLLWQTEGYVDTDATSASDILEKAGLDWDVKLLPLTVPGPDGKGTVADARRKAIVRADTHQILGVAKSRYVTANNSEVLEFLDSLFDTGQAKYEAAWSWHGGESVGVAMRIPDDITIAGVDKYGLYVLARTSHDGGGSVVVAATPIRLACTNMVTAALKGAKRIFRAPHTSSLAGRVQEAKATLDIAYTYTDAWNVAAEALLAEPCSKQRFVSVTKEVFGERHVEPAVEFWMGLDNIADYRATRYGAYNALTEFAQWERPRTPHLESVLRGPISRQSDQAYQLLAV